MWDKNIGYQNYISAQQKTRWATEEEVQYRTTRLDLADPPYATGGVPFMNDGKTAWVDGLDNHTLILGSTGSKKTRLFVMPTLNILANAGESFVVTDPKGELFERTSGLCRELGYHVVVMNMRDFRKSDGWNPLEQAYRRYQAGDIDGATSSLNDLISAVSQPSKERAKDIFWIQTAESLMFACGMILLKTGKASEVNMASLVNMCLDYGRPLSESALARVTQFLHPLSMAAQNIGGVMLKDAEKTKESIFASLFAMLKIFTIQKSLMGVLARSSFSMEAIGREKTAVYLVIPDEKDTFHFLASMFIKQCYESLIEEAQRHPGGQLPVRVNFVLDEFANIPAIPAMTSMISAARSRNIRFDLVVQSMHQLKRRYGDDAGTITGNCSNWVFLNSKEWALLEEISMLCGTYITPGGNEERLISVSQLQRLDKTKGESLIFCERAYPFITEMADIDKCCWAAPKPAVWPERESAAYDVLDLKALLGNLDEECNIDDESTLLFADEAAIY